MADQVKQSESLTQIKKNKNFLPITVILLVSGFNPLKNKDLDVITYHKNQEIKTKKSYFKHLSYVCVELDRFVKEEDDLSSIADFWLFFFSKACNLKNPPKQLADRNIEEAFEVVERSNWTLEELKEYNTFMDHVRSEATKFDVIKEEINKAIKEKDEFKKERDEFKKERDEFKKERDKAVNRVNQAEKQIKQDIVKSCLQQNIPLEEIAKITSLCIDEVNSIADNLETLDKVQ